ncbi:hypothetical protein ACF0H5_006682 [Mactra antiquata]
MKMDCLSVESSPHRQGKSSTRDNIDVMTGEIYVVPEIENNNNIIKSKMYMKVFKNAYEHHAQIYTDSEHRHTFGFLSLRNCCLRVNKEDRIICIVIKKDSGTTEFTFEAESQKDVDEWVTSLTPDKHLSLKSHYSPEPSPLIGRKIMVAV